MNKVNTLNSNVYNFLFPKDHNPVKEKVDAFLKDKLQPLLDTPVPQDAQGQETLKGYLNKVIPAAEKLGTELKNFQLYCEKVLLSSALTVFGSIALPLYFIESTVGLLLTLSAPQVVTAIAVYTLVVGGGIMIYNYSDTRIE